MTDARVGRRVPEPGALTIRYVAGHRREATPVGAYPDAGSGTRRPGLTPGPTPCGQSACIHRPVWCRNQPDTVAYRVRDRPGHRAAAGQARLRAVRHRGHPAGHTAASVPAWRSSAGPGPTGAFVWHDALFPRVGAECASGNAGTRRGGGSAPGRRSRCSTTPSGTTSTCTRLTMTRPRSGSRCPTRRNSGHCARQRSSAVPSSAPPFRSAIPTRPPAGRSHPRRASGSPPAPGSRRRWRSPGRGETGRGGR
jgi:hypothetical protein